MIKLRGIPKGFPLFLKKMKKSLFISKIIRNIVYG